MVKRMIKRRRVVVSVSVSVKGEVEQLPRYSRMIDT